MSLDSPSPNCTFPYAARERARRRLLGAALVLLSATSATALTCGDCDGNGAITILDALKIAQIDVGIQLAPPACGEVFNACNASGVPCPSTAAALTVLDALIVAIAATGGAAPVCGLPVGEEVTYATAAVAATLPSTADSAATAVCAWQLQLTDAGADGLAASLRSLTLRPGPGNQLPDWSVQLGGARLLDVGGGGQVLASAQVTSGSLAFSGLTLVVPNGGGALLAVEVFAGSGAGALSGLDGDSLVLELAPLDLVTSGAGSAVAAAQLPVSTGPGNLVVAIECTEIGFTTQPQPVVPIGSSFAPVVLACHDDHRNLDDDFGETVTLTRVGGAGMLASTDPGGLIHAFAGGTATWSNLSASAEGLLRVRATTTPSGITGDSSWVAVTSNPRITAVVPDRGPAEGDHFVQVQGLGFAPGSAVRFDSRDATDIQVLTPGLLTCRVPPAQGGSAGTAVAVEVGALVAPAAYLYLPDAHGPGLVTSLPRRNAAVIAPAQRFAFLFESRLAAGSVQHPNAAGSSSVALEQAGFLSGFAHVSEDLRWVVARRAAGSYAGGTRVIASVFGSVAGVNALADVHGNVIPTQTTVAGRDAVSIATLASVTVMTDAVPPVLVTAVPAAGAIGVPRGAPLQLTLSEPIDVTTVRTAPGGPVAVATFRLTPGASGDLSFSSDGRTIRFLPHAPLAAATTYELLLSLAAGAAAIEDLAGNPMAGVTLLFTTTAAGGLTVSRCEPPEGDLGGGMSVQVVGEGFAPGAAVSIGGVPAPLVLRRSSSQLEVVVPPATAAGAVDVSVTNPDGAVVTGAGLWSYSTAVPVDLLEPQLLFEHPLASALGTTPCPRNASLVLVMSEPVSVAPEALSVGASESVALEADLGVVLRLTSDPRILVIDKATAFAGAPVAFLVPRRAADPTRGMRDDAGNRLSIFHPDRAFSAQGADPALGLRWSDGGLDMTAPTITVREPAASSSGNHLLARITVFTNEAINPASIEIAFAVSDGAGTVPGSLAFELETMRGWHFDPARAYVGAVTVDPRFVTDLAGNPVGGATYAFTIGADLTAPVLSDLTLNDVPTYLRDSSSGGDAAIGGRLRVAPTGFTIDLRYGDSGGRMSTDLADFFLSCSRDVGGHPAGMNLALLFPPEYFHADQERATFLVPPSLPFPGGVSDATAEVCVISARVRDSSGNSSGTSALTFDCVQASAAVVPLEATEVWYLSTFRNHEDTSATLSAYLLSPGADGCPVADAEDDFMEDLLVHGLGSLPPAFNPSGADPVASGAGLTINDAATNWVANRMIYHVYRLYGLAVDWADGRPNPGFGSIREFEPVNSVQGADIRFRHAAQSPGVETSRMALGGFKEPGVAGIAGFDLQNANRVADVGETCFPVNAGVFSLVDAAFELDGSPSSLGRTYRTLFDPVSPFNGAVIPNPLGAGADDPFVCDPQADPTTFSGARRQRYEQVLVALDAFAQRQAIIAAHEIGHSIGLMADGDPGTGLYGGDAAAFPGSTSAHVDLRIFFPPGSTNVMSPVLPLDASLSRYSTFDALARAYLQARGLVVR